MTQSERRTITASNPFIISNPSLAFVNLAGDEGKDLMAKDRAALEDIFRDNIQIADRTLPRCNVLFLYCALEASGGRIAGMSFTFRDLIKGAGAHIAVLASGVPSALLSNPEFIKTLPDGRDWPANVVITLSRNGEHFGRFFHRLFALMQEGISMPMAWVQLAPQGPVQPHDIPGALFIAEAGHIAFGPRKG
jgi:hypothetical protein